MVRIPVVSVRRRVFDRMAQRHRAF